MKASEKCYNLIMSFEGCAIKAYQCSGGRWTIGYGHTTSVHPDQVITKEQARQLLMQDVNLYESYVNENIVKKIDYELTQGQFDALVSFSYNLGSISTKSGLHACIMMGDHVGAVEKLLLYTKSGGSSLLGLHRRRFAEALLFTGFILNEVDKQRIRTEMDNLELNQKGIELMKWYERELK